MRAPAPLALGLSALMLTGCAGRGLTGSVTEQPSPPSFAGRWMLAAPGAPPCGIELREAAGGQNGTLMPDGGCPGQFYLSRRWAMEDGKLVIKTDDDEPLAQLGYAGGRFEGQSTSGLNVTLSR